MTVWLELAEEMASRDDPRGNDDPEDWLCEYCGKVPINPTLEASRCSTCRDELPPSCDVEGCLEEREMDHHYFALCEPHAYERLYELHEEFRLTRKNVIERAEWLQEEADRVGFYPWKTDKTKLEVDGSEANIADRYKKLGITIEQELRYYKTLITILEKKLGDPYPSEVAPDLTIPDQFWDPDRWQETVMPNDTH